MDTLHISMVSPLPVYLDEAAGAETLAQRPASLEGMVVGLLPNWRPSAYDLLRAVGDVVKERCRPAEIVLEQPLREVPVRKGKLLDGMGDQLDALAERVDVLITATGD